MLAYGEYVNASGERLDADCIFLAIMNGQGKYQPVVEVKEDERLDTEIMNEICIALSTVRNSHFSMAALKRHLIEIVRYSVTTPPVSKRRRFGRLHDLITAINLWGVCTRSQTLAHLKEWNDHQFIDDLHAHKMQGLGDEMLQLRDFDRLMHHFYHEGYHDDLGHPLVHNVEFIALVKKYCELPI